MPRYKSGYNILYPLKDGEKDILFSGISPSKTHAITKLEALQTTGRENFSSRSAWWNHCRKLGYEVVPVDMIVGTDWASRHTFEYHRDGWNKEEKKRREVESELESTKAALVLAGEKIAELEKKIDEMNESENRLKDLINEGNRSIRLLRRHSENLHESLLDNLDCGLRTVDKMLSNHVLYKE